MNIYNLYQNYIITNKKSPPQQEYEQVDYIQSTGTQYIDTGLLANYGYNIELKFYITEGNTDQTIVGGDASSYIYLGANFAEGYKNFYRHQFNGWVNEPLNVLTNNTLYEVQSILKNNQQYLSINGTSVFSQSFSLSGDYQIPLMIFARYGTTAYNASIKLYYLKIKQTSSIILRDYVPVLNKTINKYGLLDKIENKFYGNDGSGDFLGGND